MMRIPDDRSRFLKELQFKADPFLTPVAEQELLRLKSLFFNFFVPIPSSHGLLSPQMLLKRQEHDFIFGAPGSGKTTLRLALEAETRSVITPIVTVSYLFGEQSYHLHTEEHLLSLGQALAVDLVVHLLERFDPLDTPPSKEQVQALSKLVNIGGTKLKRTLCTIRDAIGAQDTDPYWGIAHFWETLGKMPVRYVEGSQALANLISTVLEDEEASSHSLEAGIELETILEIARLWGISRIFLLVDAIDTVNLPAQTLLNSVKSLLELLSALHKYPLSAKFFLPLELLEGIQEYSPRFRFNFNFIIIDWNERWQNELICQRLRAVAGGPRYSSLDQLAEPGLDLSAKLIAASERSPRRLLQIINRLLSICAKRERGTIAITRSHWQQLVGELEQREDFPEVFWSQGGLHE